jgi:hypothetical protein
MTEGSSIPSELGRTWDEFLRAWCFGSGPGYSMGETIEALRTLKRLWPEYLERLTGDSARGLGVIVPAIELGRILKSCEPAPRFLKVFQRLVGPHAAHGLPSKERAPYSELVLVDALSQLGFKPEHEYPIAGRVLDAMCEIEGACVCFEVVTPNRADIAKELDREVQLLTSQLRTRQANGRAEIELFVDLDEERRDRLVHALASTPVGVWHELEGVGRFRVTPVGHALPQPFDGDGPRVSTVGSNSAQGHFASAIIRYESSDARLARIFHHEYKQFCSEVANVLVMDVTANPDAFGSWPEEIARRLLQPSRNRNVGAVVLFWGGQVGDPLRVRRRWRAVVNTFARIDIPRSLLTALEELDESRHFGLQVPGRVVAS